jgi:two-component system, NtrC family, response regulator HydG
MKEFTGTRVAMWAESPTKLVAIENALARMGCEINRAESSEQLSQWMKSGSVDLIVTWLDFEDNSAFELLTGLKDIPAVPPVLVVGNGLGWELYLEVMRLGAYDCVGIPLDENELARIVGKAMETVSLRQNA